MERVSCTKMFCNDRNIIKEQVQQGIRNIENRQQHQVGSFQSQKRRKYQWKVDPFWEIYLPQPPEGLPEDQPEPSSSITGPAYHEYIPMEEGEIESDTKQVSLNLGVLAVSLAKYVGGKSVQYIDMCHALIANAEEPNDWDLGNAEKERPNIILHKPTATNDGNHNRSQTPQFPFWPQTSRTGQKNAWRKFTLQKETIKKIQLCLLRGPHYRTNNLRTIVLSRLHKRHSPSKRC